MIVALIYLGAAEGVDLHLIGSPALVHILIDNQIDTKRHIDIGTIGDLQDRIILGRSVNGHGLELPVPLDVVQHFLTELLELKHGGISKGMPEQLCISNILIPKGHTTLEGTDAETHTAGPIADAEKLPHLIIDDQNTLGVDVVALVLSGRRAVSITSTVLTVSVFTRKPTVIFVCHITMTILPKSIYYSVFRPIKL